MTKPARQLSPKPLRPRKRYKLAALLTQCKGRRPVKELITGRVGKELL